MKEALKNAKNDLQSINNPPKQYEKVIDKLLELYLHTEKIVSLASNPNGSFVSCNKERMKLSEETV